MDYSEFKGFQVLLFFGLPLAFAVWQLIVTQRAQKAANEANDSPTKRDDCDSWTGSWRPHYPGCRQCVCAGVSCIDAIGMAHGCEEYDSYGDDPKHPYSGTSFSIAAARSTIDWLPARFCGDCLYSGSGKRVSAYVVA